MNRTFFNYLTLAGLASTIPTVTQAQCRNCAPVANYAPVANCAISQTRPVVTTQLRPQQVTTYRDVTETHLQRQQVVENVPVTTCKNVTVDEGGYQMVWVPKPVTKQVTQTTVRQQVKTVEVPVQVTRRVPQLTTQMVPVPSVQYVTQQVPVQMMTMARPACDACSNNQAFGLPLLAPQIGGYAPMYQPAPDASAMVPQYTAINSMAPQTVQVPVPAYQPAPAAVVPRSAASDVYETVPAREVPLPKDEVTAPAPVRKTSMFTGVPSAAAVWQSRNSMMR